MGSTRLPGKVRRDLGGKPVLAWVVQAAQMSGACDEIIVATTTEAADDEVVALARQLGVSTARGPVEDVLTRFLVAIDVARADVVIRLTSDCPLLDPAVIAVCADEFDPEQVDYVATEHDTPEGMAHGFDVEVLAASTLRALDTIATEHDRTHVTSRLWTHPGEYRFAFVRYGEPSADLRVTLDEPADAQLLDAIVAELGDEARDSAQVIELLRGRPDLVAINASVAIKPLTAG